MRRSLRKSNVAGTPDVRQENTISTHRRLAVGLCALCVALLFGGFGEPVAVADPETGDPVNDTQDVGEQGEGPGTTVAEPTEGTLGAPMALNGATNDQAAAAVVITDNTGTDSSPAATSQESNEPETVVSHTPESSSDSQTSNVEAASLTNAEVNSLTSGEVNSPTDDQVKPPAGDPPAAEPAVVQPVTNAVESVESPA